MALLNHFSLLALATTTVAHTYHIPATISKYFDVASTDPASMASVVVVFHTGTTTVFPGKPPSNFSTLAQIAVSFPNRARASPQWRPHREARPSPPQLTTTTTSPAAIGAAPACAGCTAAIPTRFSWTRRMWGFTGRFCEDKVAPAHYPCGPAEPGLESMAVAPGIGWVNSLPDAQSSVNLTVQGTKLAFAGTGYHDKVRPSAHLDGQYP
ncbi:hypothetical protein C8R46DRAFT_1235373 [Mycena filopes]|nr:hypothetical protein C8R46DRAFT_1235373 [Mycena filopes]